MAIAAATVWELRTTGSDNSGGGFVAGASGTDFSQQDAAQANGTDLVIDGTTNTLVSSATHNFVAADVGNLIQITAGTGFTTGFFQIVSVAANKATLDRSAGVLSSTAGTWAMGGALASPGKLASGIVGGNTAWVKSGTYTFTSASTNIAGGCMSINVSPVRIFNYEVTRGDNGAKSTLIADGVITTFTLLTLGSSAGVFLRGIKWDGNSRTASGGINTAGTSGNHLLAECEFRHFTTRGVTFTSRTMICYKCYATANVVLPFDGGQYLYCVSTDNNGGANTSHGFRGIAFYACIAARNDLDGFDIQDNSTLVANCIAIGNGIQVAGNPAFGNGFYCRSASIFPLMVNNVAWGNGNHGFESFVVANNLQFQSNASGGNTGTDYGTNITADSTAITLTADPFVNSAGNDFRINNVTGGGASLKAAGQPVTFPLLPLTTSAPDLGATQRSASSGGGGILGG